MTSGSDVWLNTPEPPLEASGTSGSYAGAINPSDFLAPLLVSDRSVMAKRSS